MNTQCGGHACPHVPLPMYSMNFNPTALGVYSTSCKVSFILVCIHLM